MTKSEAEALVVEHYKCACWCCAGEVDANCYEAMSFLKGISKTRE